MAIRLAERLPRAAHAKRATAAPCHFSDRRSVTSSRGSPARLLTITNISPPSSETQARIQVHGVSGARRQAVPAKAS